MSTPDTSIVALVPKGASQRRARVERREVPPLHLWRRHHPTAKAIALDLLAAPDLLRLRAGLLVADVRDKYHVGGCTARIAVAMARRNRQQAGEGGRMSMIRSNIKVPKPRRAPAMRLRPCTECGYDHNTAKCPVCGNEEGSAATPRRRPRAIEDSHQAALFRWASMQVTAHPELAMLMHVPNGGARNPREGARLKRQGVRAGYPDLVLDVARGGYFGLRIELKAPRAELGRTPETSPEQVQWFARLDACGYRVAVVEGWKAARDVLLHYLSLPPTLALPRGPVL